MTNKDGDVNKRCVGLFSWKCFVDYCSKPGTYPEFQTLRKIHKVTAEINESKTIKKIHKQMNN